MSPMVRSGQGWGAAGWCHDVQGSAGPAVRGVRVFRSGGFRHREPPMTSTILHGLLAAGLLAAMHLFSSSLPFDRAGPRNRWLSLGGGISVAYGFLHLLPELAQHPRTIDGAGEALRDAAPRWLAGLQHPPISSPCSGSPRTTGSSTWLCAAAVSPRAAIVANRRAGLRSGSACPASPCTAA